MTPTLRKSMILGFKLMKLRPITSTAKDEENINILRRKNRAEIAIMSAGDVILRQSLVVRGFLQLGNLEEGK